MTSFVIINPEAFELFQEERLFANIFRSLTTRLSWPSPTLESGLRSVFIVLNHSVTLRGSDCFQVELASS